MKNIFYGVLVGHAGAMLVIYGFNIPYFILLLLSFAGLGFSFYYMVKEVKHDCMTRSYK